MTAADQQEWVPLMEGVRIIARAKSKAFGDRFTSEELSVAAGRLARAGREGRLRAEGLRYLDHQASPLVAQDWMTLRIYEGDTLDDPHHNPRAFRVRVTKVAVDARDVRSLLPTAREQERGSLPPKTSERPRPPDAKVCEIVAKRHADRGEDLPTFDEDAKAVREIYPEARKRQIVAAREPFKPPGGWTPGPRRKKTSQSILPKSTAGEREK